MGFSNLPVDNGVFILPVQGGFIVKYHEYSFVPEFEPSSPPGPQLKKASNGPGMEKADKAGKINAYKEHTVVCESIEKLNKLVTEIMLAKKLVADKLGQELFGDSIPGTSPGYADQPKVAEAVPAGMSL